MAFINSELSVLPLEKILEKISAITLQIQQCRGLEDILQWAIDDIRTFLQTDRVLVYRFLTDEDAVIALESVSADWIPIIGQLSYDPCLKATWIEQYFQRQITSHSTIHAEHLPAYYVEWLERLQVQADLVIPILSQNNLWGLLIVHHCHSPREWQPLEVQYLQQVACLLGIAVQQADLVQQAEQQPYPCSAPEFEQNISRQTLIADVAEEIATDTPAQKQVELALQESEERFRRLCQCAPVGIFLTDVEGHYTDVNDYWCQLTQLTAAQTWGQGWKEAIHPDDRLRVFAEWQAFLQHKRSLNLECRFLRPDGISIWVAVQATSLRDPEDRVTGFIGTVSDIRDRKWVEEKHQQTAAVLQEREYYYAQILNAVQDMVFCKGPGSIVIYANQAACDYYGMTVEQLRGITDVPFNQLDFTQQYIQDDLYVFATGEVINRLEEPNQRPDGKICYFHTIKSPIFDANGNVSHIVGVSRDVTERKQAETLLRRYERIVSAIPDGVSFIDRNYIYQVVNQTYLTWMQKSYDEIVGHSVSDLLGQEFFETFSKPRLDRCLAGETLQILEDWRDYEDGQRRYFRATYTPYIELDGTIAGVVVNVHNLTDLKQTEATLHQQTERERLLMAIAQNIRQTLDLGQILHTAVTEVRQLLQVDRVVIYRFEANWSGIILAESVAAGWQSILGRQITDTYFAETQGQLYLQGNYTAIDDIYTADLDACHIEMMEQIQVRAKLVVPILQNDHLWGLLVAHHCQNSRCWESFEVALQQQLATQIAIAIQQSELYEQVQTLNAELEVQVQERTAQLQQSLHFEELLKRITDKVRDSLDEQQILQAVVEELACGLQIETCDTGIYNAAQTTSTIAYEFTNTLSPALGRTFAIAHAPHSQVYPFLFQGQVCQFCDVLPDPLRPEQRLLTVLACPIRDEKGVLGDIWLFKPFQEVFNELEVRLVQQVANQCAIALRQSRLYQAAQAQVQELERLNQLKDDFLSTVSHELRTPMSNIRIATQMLEISLERLGISSDESNPVHRYFNILREEGQREISLINDLLDLTRLDAEIEPLQLQNVDLQVYIPHLVEAFVERMHQQQQQLVLQIPADLPPFMTDLPYLERILTELLHNACKYTPAAETITVSVQLQRECLEICVSNSGVEIPSVERDRIFDKFYRIPNNDPWKHGGTGLGLALVKKLTERLGGSIRVESEREQTTFILEFFTSPSN